MSIETFDRTLFDIGRRNLNLRQYKVEEVLPGYIIETYPKLVKLLSEYYHIENEEFSPSRLIDELFTTRDISQTDLDLLAYIEDELLLGQSYFGGFSNKRDAAKYSNLLYRSKGTKYSIQQFFRMFFSIDPDIIYTKKYIFNVGESFIGAESQKYITDDKLYQTFALQIKSELPSENWRSIYKTFVHPAGMYLGAEVQIVGFVDLAIEDQPNPGVLDLPPYEVSGQAALDMTAHSQHTAMFNIAGISEPITLFRTNMGSEITYPAFGGNDLIDLQNRTLKELDDNYSSIGEYLTPDSPTLDDDDDVGNINGMKISSTEPINQERFTWIEPNDSDSEKSLIELL